uniref:NADH-ubiquinone oxidoreductase chain 6 n=1 Tax=Callicerus obscurus TaxID=877884 RepID=A0A0S2M6X9_9COLE|nr:NADH dehydrogenase subunit 6 [Callicerus obscurus]ALO70434.1 NADH deshydrogenase subunit 6 [Callicerus obscurus]
MLMMMNFLLSLIFLFMNHPMSLGLTLLMQTLIISMITGMLAMNFWFSYILFLIMIGGMLVLFIYMTSIASNEMFSYSNKIFLMMSLMSFMLIILYMVMDMYFLNLNYIFFEQSTQFNNLHTNLTKYFNYPSMFIIFFMIIYLFITLIAVVKIIKIEYGPLRQKF